IRGGGEELIQIQSSAERLRSFGGEYRAMHVVPAADLVEYLTQPLITIESEDIHGRGIKGDGNHLARLLHDNIAHTHLPKGCRHFTLPIVAEPTAVGQMLEGKAAILKSLRLGSGLPLDLEALRVFVQVAELGSLTKAAVLLDTVQPAVSRTIAALEPDCAGRLFHRTGRGLVLTEFGEQILPQVKALLLQSNLQKDEMKSVRGLATVM